MSHRFQKYRLWKLMWWFSPPRCPICDEVVIPFSVCGECAAFEKKLRKPQSRLENKPSLIDEGFCRWKYKAEIRHAIVKMKFSHQPHHAENLILLLCCDNEAYTFVRQFDIIVPVPSTARKIKDRGYDVPYLLAKALRNTVDIPLAPKESLVKIKETSEQVGLSGQRRRENLKNAFAVQNPSAICGKRVLLVDDVMTTGTTLTETAKKLKQAGAAWVGGLVLAQTD